MIAGEHIDHEAGLAVGMQVQDVGRLPVDALAHGQLTLVVAQGLERVDQMQAWHTHMEGEMKKRGDAAKTFYAVLNPEQKKVFDAETARFMAGAEGRHMHHPH